MTLSLPLCFNGHFPGKLGLDGFIWAKDDVSGGNNWSYKSCESPVRSSPPTNQHPTFQKPDALPVAQPTVSKHWREKYHIPWTCLGAHLGVFQLCLWPLCSWLPWGGLPCLSSALWCQYHKSQGWLTYSISLLCKFTIKNPVNLQQGNDVQITSKY